MAVHYNESYTECADVDEMQLAQDRVENGSYHKRGKFLNPTKRQSVSQERLHRRVRWVGS
jgi:hypothetical protein